MKQWKTITPYIVALCLASMTLTGCGGEYDVTTGKGGATSGSAISGSAVSGGAINETEEKKVDEKSQTSVEQRYLQEMYPYCNSKFAYSEKNGKLLQVPLEGEEKIQKFSLPGMEFEGKYDEDKHPWLYVLYVSDEEIVYQVISVEVSDEGKESAEMWSVPLRRKGDTEYPNGSQGQKIMEIEDCDGFDVFYIDETYIAYEDLNGYHEYNREEKKDTFREGEMWYVSEESPCKMRKQIILESDEGTKEYSEGIYYHTIGSDEMELFYEYSEQGMFFEQPMIRETEDGILIYYAEEAATLIDRCSLYCYDTKTKTTECVITPKQWKKMLGGKYLFEHLYENGNRIYLEMSKVDDEMCIPYIFTYTPGSGLQEEKELNDLLQKRKGDVWDIRGSYALIDLEIKGNEVYYIYGMRTGKKEKVKDIYVKNNFIY